MLVTGKIYPNKYDIVHTKTNIEIYFSENIKENREIINDKLVVSYNYDRYKTSILYRPDYKKFIEENKEALLERAKEEEYKELSKKIREKRNNLLIESDSEMILDRMNLEVPDGNTFASWKPFFKTLGEKLTGDWAKYRQALRDLPLQKGFPYKVKFPEKPE